jgi:hypothetical protein
LAHKKETSIFELIKYFTLILFHGAILIKIWISQLRHFFAVCTHNVPTYEWSAARERVGFERMFVIVLLSILGTVIELQANLKFNLDQASKEIRSFIKLQHNNALSTCLSILTFRSDSIQIHCCLRRRIRELKEQKKEAFKVIREKLSDMTRLIKKIHDFKPPNNS